jgi:transposase
LKNRKAEEIHACLESTGGFDEALAFDLHERGIVISVVNTSRIKSLAQSKFLRTKTDRVDAALIARFCWAPWLPPAPESPPCRPLWAATQAFKTCF